MKKIKLLIILLVIILLILIGTIVILKINVNSYKNEEGDPGEVIDYNNQETKQVTSNIDFYTVSNCINQYLEITNLNSSMYYGYDENNNYTKIIDDNEIKENIYNLLDSTYIESNGITIENIFNHINTINEKIIFLPTKMNVLEKANVNVYSIYGIEYTLENKYVGDAYFIVSLDKNNYTFSIQPIQSGQYKDINEIKLVNDDELRIEKNIFNEYTSAKITYESLVQNYMISYKTLALVKPDIIYELLDEEYRNKRFGNLENFETYVKENTDIIRSVNLQSYQVNNNENYTQYVCTDQYGKYYIFNETAVMDYKLILDTYTIDLPQFTEKYNNSSDAQKVLLNIQKVFEAINDGDYGYVYNKLDATFKQNNFPTLEEFEKYVENNFYKKNTAQASNYQTNGDLHIYQVTIKNTDNSEDKNITKNFIMQLLDGTDFVMSFNV